MLLLLCKQRPAAHGTDIVKKFFTLTVRYVTLITPTNTNCATYRKIRHIVFWKYSFINDQCNFTSNRLLFVLFAGDLLGNNVASLKAIMPLIGLDLGPSRLPLRAATKDEQENYRKDLDGIGFFSWNIWMTWKCMDIQTSVSAIVFQREITLWLILLTWATKLFRCGSPF